MTDLNETLAIRTARGWRPQPGETLEATLVALEKREGDYGAYPCLIYRTDEGQYVAVHAFHDVLKDEYAKLHAAGQTQPGRRHTVHYAGRQASKNIGPDGKPRQYESYVVLDTTDGAPQASELGADEQAALFALDS